MAGLRLRGTAALAAGLLTLGLAGCAGAGERFPVQRVEPGDLDLESVLLEVGDIPQPGWVAQPPSDDDPAVADDAPVDDETGGVCAMEFTDVMSLEMQATEVGAGFTNEALITMLAESSGSPRRPRTSWRRSPNSSPPAQVSTRARGATTRWS